MRRLQFKYRYLIISLMTIGVGGLSEEFSVQERLKEIELSTPWGKKVIISDSDPNQLGNYRYEIPLSELRPPTKAPQLGPNGEPLSTQNNQTNSTNNTTESHKHTETQKITEIFRQESSDDKNNPQRNPASLIPRVVVEYDETDKMVLEANHLFNKRKFYAATSIVEEILRKKPDYTRAWLMKGSLLKIQGQTDLAKAAYQKALALEPNNKEISDIVGRMK